MKSTSAVPERILITGLQGSGKTEAAARTAQKYRETGTPGTMYWVNTDIKGTVERCNERWADWQSNIQWADPRNWEEFDEAVEKFAGVAQPGDWLVIDSIDKAWEFLQGEFLKRKEAKLGKSRGKDLFGTSDVEISGDDYNTRINPAYRRWLRPLLDDCPAHILAMSPAKPIVVEGMYATDKSVTQMLGQYGVAPAGQKHLVFEFHTVLLANYLRGKYTLTTMGKDRSHKPVKDLELGELMGFPEAYLADIAGWKE